MNAANGPAGTASNSPRFPLIEPLGDSALLVVFGESVDVALNARVHVLAAAVSKSRQGRAVAWGRPVPAYSSLLLPYDPDRWRADEAVAALAPLLAALTTDPDASVPAAPAVEIDVRYGGVDGPDLEEVAALHGLTPQEVVAIHSQAVYRVFMLGFAPGFAYMGPVPEALVTPRRATPRTRVPTGSVGIAGNQTGVYPLATPGGWRLLGRTDAVLWDPRRESPALLRPGLLVRFRPV